ncbi:hypothetical protein DPMN_092196 [Dreissena polymorpha]|uniref:Uncharacterized protein n=1 Tax=Dreissena polymorpha TaxID=45954 RepID=A0A9D4L358_DREPO|nr:hypothetical protein DPMN_092196 [Dreissena polymorpha]
MTVNLHVVPNVKELEDQKTQARSLLHKLIWNKGSMFGEIVQGYLEFIGRNSQGDSCVVFDGYPESATTKDTAHIRRTKGICGQAVIFSLYTPCKIKKDVFLTILQNKQKFIYFLDEYLSNRDV